MKFRELFGRFASLENADELYNEARRYSQAGDYKKAIELYTRVIQTNSCDEEAYNNRGTCYYRMKEYQKAMADFTQAIEINPSKANSYTNRAGCYLELGDIQKALQDDNKSIELNAGSAISFNNRGDTYLKLRKYKEAIRDFTYAIKLSPDYSKAYHNRGIAYLEQKDYKKAISDFSHVIDRHSNGEVYCNRGRAYYGLGGVRKAIEDWETAIRLSSRLEKELRSTINEAKKHLGIDLQTERNERTYDMDKLYKRLDVLVHSSSDGTINLKHDTYDFLQFMEMTDFLNTSYTQEKTNIATAELRELLLKARKSNKILTEGMLNEMVELLMGE
jgi:tetratricopeptide (TPR) repeat protein